MKTRKTDRRTAAKVLAAPCHCGAKATAVVYGLPVCALHHYNTWF